VDEFGNLKMQEEIESNNFTRYRSSLIVICGVIKKFNWIIIHRSKTDEIQSQVNPTDLQTDDHPGVNSSSEILDVSSKNTQNAKTSQKILK
jgi:hypothetical protein